MTTNGQGLANRIRDLKSAGLSSINISIDSLIPEKYWSITRGGSLADVLAGVRTSLEIGMNPVKINVVVIKGVNDSEIPGFIEWTRYLPLDVRFIELMPIGRLGQGSENRLSSQEILRLHPEFQPVQPRETGQPSQDYIIPGYKGRIGLISPITHKFCSGCNRIRVSHDGRLKLCLGQNQEFDLKPYLDSSRSELARILSDRVFLKPEGHFFDQDFHSYRTMNDIGG
jgi:cyclic pyranopterin phosphate synthase